IMSMKTSYRERDYEYGEAMLKLRTALGLTQERLGKLVGISRRSVTEWEAGCSYPKTEHLKALIELAVQRQAFSTESQTEEIRQIWNLAHQQVPPDEDWLCALLSQCNSPQGEIVQTCDTRQEEIGASTVCPYSAGPELEADPVLCSNLLPPV